MSKRNIGKVVKATVDNLNNSGDSLPQSQLNNIAVILESLDLRRSDNTIHIDETLVETLGSSGVTVKNACSLLHKSFQYFDENPTMLAAYNRGRATLGSRVRSKLIEAALDNDNIQSAIHLDKIFSADAVPTEFNITVGQSQLSTVSDEDLLRVAFTVDDGVDEDTVAPTVTKPDAGDTHSGKDGV